MIADLLTDPAVRLVIGHRGAAGSAPENTLRSFDLALEQGAKALELDVRLTGDGIPVVIHDPSLDRTTDRTGSVGELSYAAIHEADAGAQFSSSDGFPFREIGIRVPTFREVLERYAGVPLLVELKEIRAALPVRAELKRAGAEGRVVLASFLHAALDPFRADPFHVGASRRDIVRLKLRSLHLPWAAPARVVAFAVPFRYRDQIAVPTHRFIRAARRLGAPVHVWTVDDVGRAQGLWAAGASGMITNYPARLAG